MMLINLFRVATKVHIYPGLPHGFRRWPQLPAAAVFGDDTMKSLQWALERGRSSEQAGLHGNWDVFGS